MQNRKIHNLILSILPGILLYLAWPPKDLFFLSFIAFVPLLMLEAQMRGKHGFYGLLYLSLFIWNVLTTWWVWYASPGGAVFMLFANTALMTLPWVAYRKAIPTFGQRKAYMVLVSLWITFEYLHLNWEITWPWLTLGNVFAKHNFTVQWYEFTGTLGGSLWILITNILVHRAVTERKRLPLALMATLSIPLLTSFVVMQLRKSTYTLEHELEAIIVQPNIDPYEKFNYGEDIPNLKRMLLSAEEKVTDNTRYVIMPETAIVEYIDEESPISFESIRLVQAFAQRNQQLTLITGVSTYDFYDASEKRSPTARQANNGDYYESYNTAMEVDRNGGLTYYHKSKLVPGVEKMPYPQVFGFLEKLSIDMGGISGSLGSDKEPTVFKAGDQPDVAALICYESVFPGFVTEFTRKGAEVLLVITNDGWWKNTDGYKQHMYYATLRAIENRREVLRSANTGISCKIDRFGHIESRTEWWTEDILETTVTPSGEMTLFSRTGNYLGRIGSFIGIFFVLGLFVTRKTQDDQG